MTKNKPDLFLWSLTPAGLKPGVPLLQMSLLGGRVFTAVLTSKNLSLTKNLNLENESKSEMK